MKKKQGEPSKKQSHASERGRTSSAHGRTRAQQTATSEPSGTSEWPEEVNETTRSVVRGSPRGMGIDSAGQTGDTQDLSRVAEASFEDVEELVEEGQDLEADRITGVEEAGDEPETPATTTHPRRHRKVRESL